MKIKLESSDDVIYDSEFESPNIILLRNDIAKMFGMNQETIEITIY